MKFATIEFGDFFVYKDKTYLKTKKCYYPNNNVIRMSPNMSDRREMFFVPTAEVEKGSVEKLKIMLGPLVCSHKI
jgi:hypothetical protein